MSSLPESGQGWAIYPSNPGSSPRALLNAIGGSGAAQTRSAPRPSCDGTEPVSADMGLCLRTSRTDGFAALGFAAYAGGGFLEEKERLVKASLESGGGVPAVARYVSA